MNIFVVFVFWFFAAQALILLTQLPFRKKKRGGKRVALSAAVKFLLAVGFAALVLAGPVILRPVQPVMMALYTALFAEAAAEVLYAVYLRLCGAERSFTHFKLFSLALGAVFLTFGMLNMQLVVPRYHTYTSDKLSSPHRLVFVADMHVGSAQPFEVVEKTVEKIKREQPDFVILGGDMTDDYTTRDEMESAFALFSQMDCPVYYIYGNHDRQGYAEYAGGRKYTPEELESALLENGIKPLRDEFVRISPDLTLLGREDLSEADGRTDSASIVDPAPESYLIVADHQPGDFESAVSYGADLQLSGHTHAGQLFPLGWLYAAVGRVCGDYRSGSSVMNVSAGVSGWRMPLRTQQRSSFEVIDLLPAD